MANFHSTNLTQIRKCRIFTVSLRVDDSGYRLLCFLFFRIATNCSNNQNRWYLRVTLIQTHSFQQMYRRYKA